MNVLNTKYSTDPWDILILTSYWIENWQPNELNSLHKNNSVDREKQDDLWFIPNLKEKTNKPTTQTSASTSTCNFHWLLWDLWKNRLLKEKTKPIKKKRKYHLCILVSLAAYRIIELSSSTLGIFYPLWNC